MKLLISFLALAFAYSAFGQTATVEQHSKPAIPATVTSSANAAGAITLSAAGAGVRYVIKTIDGGYTAAPTGGSIVITDGGVTKKTIPITAAGALMFDCGTGGIVFTANSTVVVTIAAGGSGVVGHLNISYITTTEG